MLIDEDDLRRLQKRRAEIEHSTFMTPPADWGEFCVKRGRWLEINDRILAIEAEVRESDRLESNR